MELQMETSALLTDASYDWAREPIHAKPAVVSEAQSDTGSGFVSLVINAFAH